MREKHIDRLIESQIPILVDKSLRYNTPLIRECPICTRSAEEIGDHMAMQRHVTEELLVFALEALPWGGSLSESSSKSLEKKSSSQASRKARLDSDDRDSSSLDEDNLGSRDLSEDGNGPTKGEEGKQLFSAILKSNFVSNSLDRCIDVL